MLVVGCVAVRKTYYCWCWQQLFFSFIIVCEKLSSSAVGVVMCAIGLVVWTAFWVVHIHGCSCRCQNTPFDDKEISL